MQALLKILDSRSSFQRRGFCIIAGALAALAQAPLYWMPLLFLAFPLIFVFLEKATKPRQAFAFGWCFGFGYFLAGLYWIANSLLVEADKFAWMYPFAVSLIPAFLALYIGLLGLMVYAVPSRGLKFITFSIGWVVLEYARTYLFYGFPWNLLGQVWLWHLPIAQLGALTGIYGLSLLAVMIATIPALGRLSYIATGSSIVALVAIGGAVRMQKTESTPYLVRLVQGNIAQHMKWDAESRRHSIADYLALSGETGKNMPDVIIWPETAVSYALNEEPLLQQALAKPLKPGAVLMTGALKTMPGEIFNSLFVISSQGTINAAYDKVKIVPFGEFIPLRRFVPFVKKITYGSMDFTPGKGPITIAESNLPPLSPLICYEVIFPQFQAITRPEWLVNITNDAWFGRSSGPYQHLAMGQMRAIEQGVPLMRAANTGISAGIDPYGRILEHLPLNIKGVIDIKLPKSVRPTFYRKHGDYIVPLMIIFWLSTMWRGKKTLKKG